MTTTLRGIACTLIALSDLFCSLQKQETSLRICGQTRKIIEAPGGAGVALNCPSHRAPACNNIGPRIKKPKLEHHHAEAEQENQMLFSGHGPVQSLEFFCDKDFAGGLTGSRSAPRRRSTLSSIGGVDFTARWSSQDLAFSIGQPPSQEQHDNIMTGAPETLQSNFMDRRSASIRQPVPTKFSMESTTRPTPKQKKVTPVVQMYSPCNPSTQEDPFDFDAADLEPQKPLDSGGVRFRSHQAENWTEKYEELLDYRIRNGHCLVPNAYPDKSLPEWVKRQRYQYKLKRLGKHSTMSDDRVIALEKIGFVWNSHDAAWEERLQELALYKSIFGDCNVPSNYTPNPQLAVWVKRQRRQYKFLQQGEVSTMTPSRIEKLLALGFAWSGRKIKPAQNSAAVSA